MVIGMGACSNALHFHEPSSRQSQPAHTLGVGSMGEWPDHNLAKQLEWRTNQQTEPIRSFVTPRDVDLA